MSDRHLLTTFPDGTTIHAIPAVDDDLVGWLHDLVHHLVAEALHLEHSPTLWRVAHPDTPGLVDDRRVALEEAAVLAIQAFAREI